MVLMNPSGDIALQQRNLIIASTVLMLLIIVPVIAATVLFAWRYRAANTQAAYAPDWHHSTQLEVLIWTAPLLIIIALGALTWISAHVLDPFREVSRIDANRTIPAGTKPLVVEAVSLDWKWLFFYPDQGIATVNELAAPIDTPIQFKITSATVMNTLFVPALAGQIYAMAGMETKLGAVINRKGVFDGFSGNYSGAGFSRMNFKFHALDKAGFDAWVAKVKGRRQAARRRHLPDAGEAERRRAADLLHGGPDRPLQQDPQHVRRSRQDVHERHDGGRCERRRQGRERGDPRQAEIRRGSHQGGQRGARRDLPGLRQAAEFGRSASGHEADDDGA